MDLSRLSRLSWPGRTRSQRRISEPRDLAHRGNSRWARPGWRSGAALLVIASSLATIVGQQVATAAVGTCTPNGNDPVSGLAFNNCRYFTYNGTATVPPSVVSFAAPIDTAYSFKIWGAAGAGGYQWSVYGGHGGLTRGTISLVAGEQVEIGVGQGGKYGTGTTNTFGGGGKSMGSYLGGSGGGMSWVKKGSQYLMIAGGGGAAAGSSNADGGSGGGLVGFDGGATTGTLTPTTWNAAFCGPPSGKGGTQTAGGATGINPGNGTPGTALQGGFGASPSGLQYGGDAGGGGGGWFGGGGGGVSNVGGDSAGCDDTAGGGGSGYLDSSVTAGSFESMQVKNGVDKGPVKPPPGSTDPHYALTANVAKGLTNQSSGGNGMIVVQWVTPAPRIDPKIVKTGPATVNAGSAITYDVVVTNAGNTSTAVAIGVNDTPPAGVTGSWTCTASGGATCPVMGSSTSLAASVPSPLSTTGQVKFTFTGTVSASLAPGSLTNTATLGIPTTMTDADLTNNSSTTTAAVTAYTDVSVKKTGTTGMLKPGDVATWTLTVKNEGAAMARNATVTDVLPAVFTSPSFTSSSPGVTCTNATFSCTVATLAPGASYTVTVTGTVRSDAPDGFGWMNTATVSSALDLNGANDISSVSGSIGGYSDLEASKTQVDALIAGEVVHYKVGIKNNGSAMAPSATAVDTLPAGLTFVAAESDAACTASGQVVTCTSSAIGVGETKEFIVGARLDASTASGLSVTNPVVVSSPNPDGNTGNNTASVTGTTSRSTDLRIEKSVASGTSKIGEDVVFTVKATNDGPSNASGVVISDTLPAEFNPASITVAPSGACSVTGLAVECDPVDLAAGQSHTVTVTAKLLGSVTPGTVVTNSASVAGNEPDPTPGNNSDDAAVTAQANVALTVEKTASAATVNAGENLTWSVKVSNTGLSTANNVVAVDTLAPGMTFVATGSDSRCVPSGSTVTCTATSLAGGADTTFDIVVKTSSSLAAGGELANSASVTSTESPTPSVGTATVDVTRSVDLAITKTAPASAIAGDELTWTFEVSNAGPSDASAVSVRDALPSGFTFGSAADATCSGAPLLACDLGGLAAGASVTFTVTGTLEASLVDDSTISNTATVDAAETDSDGANNSSTAEVDITRSNTLSLVKEAASNTVSLGSPALFTLTATNEGPSAASALKFVDVLPAGLTFVPALSDASCSASGQTVTCTPSGEVAPGGKMSVVIAASTDADGEPASLTNTASVESANSGEPATGEAAFELVRDATVDASKTQTPSPAVAGSQVVWTIAVTNSGPSTARGVTIDDAVPAGITVDSVETTQGTCDETVHCDLGTLAVGVATVTITGTVGAGFVPAGETSAPLVNTATLGGPDVDPEACTGCTSTGTVLASANVVSQKIALSDPAIAGQNMSWKVTSRNEGPSIARSVVVTDTLAAGMTFVASGSDTRCSASGQTVTCEMGDLDPGEIDEVVIVVAVASSVSADATLTNTASVTSPTPDPQPGCADCTATVAVDRSADLVFAKTLTNAPLIAGGVALWQVTAKNNGPSDASGVTITDELAAELSFVGGLSDPTCSDAGQTVTCAVGTIANGATKTVVIATRVKADVAAGTELSNTITGGGQEPDPDPSCDDCTAGPFPVEVHADVAIEKSGSSLVTAGLATTYTLTVTNSGPSAATDVVVTDPMASGLTAIAASTPQGSCTVTDGKVRCELGAVAVGATVSITVDAAVAKSVAAGTTLTNTATVATTATDANTDNNTDSVSSTVQRQSGVTATKTASVATAVAGQPITYTVNVTNNGPSVATVVNVSDTIPSEITGVTVTPAGSCTIAGQVVTCAFDQVDVGQTIPVQITGTVAATVAAGTQLTNTATVDCGGECTPTNPSVTTGVTANADLVTVKRLLTDPVVAGENATWEVEVTNNGPSVATDVAVEDILDTLLTYVPDGSDVRCTADGQTVTCPIGTMTVGQTVKVQIVTAVSPDAPAGESIGNAVTTNTSTPDPNPECSGCTNPGSPTNTKADLKITKTAVTSPVIAGTVAEWDVKVENAGPSTAKAVTVTDLLDSRLSFVSAGSDVRCSVDGQLVSCPVGDIAPGASVTVRIRTLVAADVSAGSKISNEAGVDTSTPDPDPSCANCTATIDVSASADLETTKTLLTDPIVAGGLVRWQVSVKNNGPSTARSVKIEDALASSLTFDAGSSTGCVATGQDVTCDLGDVAAGQTVTRTIGAYLAAATPAGSTLSNTVAVTTPTPDPNPTCDACTASGEVTAASNLWVEKTGSSTIVAGAPVEWVISFGNTGPSNATNLTMSDKLPAGFSGATFSAPADVTCALTGLVADGQTLTCTMTSLAVDATRSVTVSATAPSKLADGAEVANTATVDAETNPTDPVTSTFTGTVDRDATLSVQKRAESAIAVPGAHVKWSIDVTNTGPSDVDGAKIVDTLGAEFSIVSVEPAADCAKSGQDVTCTLDVAKGDTVTIVIDTILDASFEGDTVANTATATCPNGECKEVTVTTELTVRPSADVVYAKTFDSPELVAGGDATFTVSAKNNGPSDAQGVTITDVLADGLTFDPATSDGDCTVSGQTVTCTATTIAAGATKSFVIGVKVAANIAADTVTNAITGTTETPDPNPECTTCSVGPIPVVRRADLVTVKSLVGGELEAGKEGVYHVDITNNGPSDATGVVITDVLPAGLTLVASKSPGCTSSGQTVTCVVGDIANGASAQVVLTVMVAEDLPADTQVINTVSVTSEVTDPDPTCAGCTTTNPVKVAADLTTKKELIDSPLVAGETARWQVTVANVGSSLSTGFTVTDELQSELSFDPAGSDTRCGVSGQTVTCTGGALTVGASTTFVISTLVASDTPVDTEISNGVVTDGNEPDPNPACDTCVAGPYPVTTIADISIVKVGSNLLTAGVPTHYAMTVSNAGPSAAADVVVTDPMTTGLTATAATSSQGTCSVTGGKVSCDLGTVAVGQLVQINVDADVSSSIVAGALLTNTATVATSTTDGDLTNNTDSAIGQAIRAVGLTAYKTASVATAVAGGSMDYVIEVHNSGPSVATAVHVADTMPTGVDIYAIESAGSCSWDGAEVGCDFDEIGVGETITVKILGTLSPGLDDGTSLTNVATVTCAPGECDPVSPEVTTGVVRRADLETVKRQLTDPMVAGQLATWEIKVTNHGPSVAEDVVADDVLDSHLTFDTDSADARCSFFGQDVRCNLGSIDPGVTETVLITAMVSPNAAEGSQIANSVSVTTPTVDPNPVCTSCTTPGTPINTKADVELTKTAVSSPVVAGKNATFKLVAVNHGPSVARSVVVSDLLDSRMTFVSTGSDSRCTAAGQLVTCTVGDLAVDAPTEMLVVAKVDSDAVEGSSIANQADIDSPTTDPNPGCDTCTATIEVAAEADVSLVKELVTDPIVAGKPVRWKLTASNAGPSTARDVKITDTLAAGLSFLAGSSTPGCSADGQDVTCALGDLLSGATKVVYLEALLASSTAAGATITNTAAITSPTTDPNPACTTCTSTGTATRVTKTWVNKTGSSDITAGVEASWSVSFGNDGPSDASDVILTDTVPTGFGGVRVDAPTGVDCSVTGLDVSCTAATIVAFGSYTVRIYATPGSSMAAGSSVDNTATVTVPTDPDGPHTSTWTSNVNRNAGVTVQKTGSAGVVVPGENFTWTVSAHNSGPSDATGVTISDTVPVGTSIVSVDSTDCTFSGRDVSCTFDLAADADFVVNIVTKVDASVTATKLSNTATVACPNGECDGGEATSEAAVTPKADVVYAKTFDSDELVAGGSAQFTVKATNHGPSDAHDVTITDVLVAGLTFDAANSDGRCTASGQTVTCLGGTIAPNDTESFVIAVKIASDIATDTVSNAITGTTSTPDPNPECETCGVGPIPVVRRADLETVKTLEGDSLVAGENGTYKIAVTNHGPSQATEVVATDVLPAGLTLVAAQSPGCTADGQTVTCYVGTIDVDQTFSVTIVVAVDPTMAGGSQVENTVTVTGEVVDPEPACAGCTTTNPVEARADLETVKTFLGTELVPGESGTWQISVINHGPSRATGVTVSDTLNAALTFDVAASDPACSADGQNITCQIGTLEPNTSKTVRIVATVASNLAAGTKISNTVVTDGEEPDPNPTCDECTAVTPPAAPKVDLELTLSGSSTAVAGTSSSFTVSVANHGPSDAAGTSIRIALPARLLKNGALRGNLTASTPAGDCTVDGTDLVCPVGAFLNGDTFDFDVTYDVPSDIDHDETLSFTGVISSEATETDLTNNVDTELVLVRRSSAITIEKTISDATPTAGTDVSWTITVRNGGTSDASNVAVTDQLPTSITNIATSDARCIVDAGRSMVKCLINPLAAGDTTTITVTGQLKADTADGAAVTNQATLSCARNLCPETSTSVTGTANTSADIVTEKTGDKTIVPGTTAKWNVKVTNNGPSVARNVTVTDTLADGLTAVAKSLPKGCTVDGQVITCVIGDMDPKASANLAFETSVDPALDVKSLQNSVDVKTETPDPNPKCPDCTIVIPVTPGADLEITKDLTTETVTPNGTVEWKIGVVNNGPGTAKDVAVSDTLIDGLTFIDDTLGICDAAGQKVTCPIGTMTPGQRVEFTLSAKNGLKAGESITNAATVTSPTPEPEGGSRKPAEAKPITVTGAATIVVAKKVVDAPETPNPGDVVTYEITATNTGNAKGTQLVVLDRNPKTLLYRSGPAGCADTGSVVRCPSGDLEPGESRTVRLSFEIGDTIGEVVNAATAEVKGGTVINQKGEVGPDSVSITVTKPISVPEKLQEVVRDTLAHTGATVGGFLIAGLTLVGFGALLMRRGRRRAGETDEA